MMNLQQSREQLKMLGDDQLSMMMQQPSGMVPGFLVLAELQRRRDMRDGPQQPPQNAPMSQTIPAQLAPMPPQQQMLAPPTYMDMPQEPMPPRGFQDGSYGKGPISPYSSSYAMQEWMDKYGFTPSYRDEIDLPDYPVDAIPVLPGQAGAHVPGIDQRVVQGGPPPLVVKGGVGMGPDSYREPPHTGEFSEADMLPPLPAQIGVGILQGMGQENPMHSIGANVGSAVGENMGRAGEAIGTVGDAMSGVTTGLRNMYRGAVGLPPLPAQINPGLPGDQQGPTLPEEVPAPPALQPDMTSPVPQQGDPSIAPSTPGAGGVAAPGDLAPSPGGSPVSQGPDYGHYAPVRDAIDQLNARQAELQDRAWIHALGKAGATAAAAETPYGLSAVAQGLSAGHQYLEGMQQQEMDHLSGSIQNEALFADAMTQRDNEMFRRKMAMAAAARAAAGGKGGGAAGGLNMKEMLKALQDDKLREEVGAELIAMDIEPSVENINNAIMAPYFSVPEYVAAQMEARNAPPPQAQPMANPPEEEGGVIDTIYDWFSGE